MPEVGKKFKSQDLLSDILNIDIKHDCLITGISADSRSIKEGDLFLAYKGLEFDGRKFIVDAINKGASMVLCENELPKDIFVEKKVSIIVVSDLRSKISLIADKFYGHPSRKLKMIAVTGTNGKTSITHYIAQALSGVDVSCGVIGTVGVGFPGALDPVINTTPDPIKIHKWLFEFNKAGAKAVAMEVSSQGLAQGRVNGIDFEIGVFTNLTREHLDCHGSMENYGNAKKQLFLKHNLKYTVINADDEFGYELINQLKGSMDIFAYTMSDTEVDNLPVVKIKDVSINGNKTSAKIISPWGVGALKSGLLGRFNLSNLLATFCVLRIMDIKVDSILSELQKLKPVEGRMQVFGGKDNKPMVVVDYAHTPNALEQVLLSLREYCGGSLWCVFGCGGDRDRGKRAIMGQIAERFSDHVVITNDNPRMEDPKVIVDDILQDLLCPWAVEVELDRMAAIYYAISHAKPTDLILIAGKGHEDYQVLGKEKVHFSDIGIVKKALK